MSFVRKSWDRASRSVSKVYRLKAIHDLTFTVKFSKRISESDINDYSGVYKYSIDRRIQRKGLNPRTIEYLSRRWFAEMLTLIYTRLSIGRKVIYGLSRGKTVVRGCRLRGFQCQRIRIERIVIYCADNANTARHSFTTLYYSTDRSTRIWILHITAAFTFSPCVIAIIESLPIVKLRLQENVDLWRHGGNYAFCRSRFMFRGMPLCFYGS